jgi:hypothetical protein
MGKMGNLSNLLPVAFGAWAYSTHLVYYVVGWARWANGQPFKPLASRVWCMGVFHPLCLLCCRMGKMGKWATFRYLLQVVFGAWPCPTHLVYHVVRDGQDGQMGNISIPLASSVWCMAVSHSLGLSCCKGWANTTEATFQTF